MAIDGISLSRTVGAEAANLRVLLDALGIRNGMTLEARVMAMPSPGTARLDIGHGQIDVETPVPLPPGTTLTLTVERQGQAVRLLAQPPAVPSLALPASPGTPMPRAAGGGAGEPLAPPPSLLPGPGGAVPAGLAATAGAVTALLVQAGREIRAAGGARGGKGAGEGAGDGVREATAVAPQASASRATDRLGALTPVATTRNDVADAARAYRQTSMPALSPAGQAGAAPSSHPGRADTAAAHFSQAHVNQAPPSPVPSLITPAPPVTGAGGPAAAALIDSLRQMLASAQAVPDPLRREAETLLARLDPQGVRPSQIPMSAASRARPVELQPTPASASQAIAQASVQAPVMEEAASPEPISLALSRLLQALDAAARPGQPREASLPERGPPQERPSAERVRDNQEKPGASSPTRSQEPGAVPKSAIPSGNPSTDMALRDVREKAEALALRLGAPADMARADLQTLAFDLPVRSGTDVITVPLTIHREPDPDDDPRAAPDEPRAIWTVRFSLSTEELGPIHATLRLNGGHVAVHLAAERVETARAFARAREDLSEALAAGNLVVDRLNIVRAGNSPEPERPHVERRS